MPIRTTYDLEADALYARFGASRRSARTIVVRPGVHLDVDDAGHVLGLEVLNASSTVDADALTGLDDPTLWLSLLEAAAIAGLSPTTLRVQLRNGRLTGEKRGRDWVVAYHVLLNYLEEVHRRASARPRAHAAPPTPATAKARRKGTKAATTARRRPADISRRKA